MTISINLPPAPIQYPLYDGDRVSRPWALWFQDLNDALVAITTASHSDLADLEWSAAGHTIDTDVDFDNNDLLNGGTINATTGAITTVNSTTGNITTVNSTTGNITTINSTTGTITTINGTTGNITTLNATTGNITTVNATTVNATTFDGTNALLSGELRLEDGANYVGFTAPVLAGTQIWKLPTADGLIDQVLVTDGSGNLSWNSNASEKSWAFDSPSGATGTFYFGGFYQFHTVSFTPAGGTNVGTANSSYAAHALVVLGAASTDMVVRVTGTSIDDSGTRTPADTEDIDTSGGAADDYYETAKKWIGQVSYTLQSGTGVIIDAGFTKYWDNSNSDFKVVGIEATWLGGANDAGVDIQLLHHKSTGWTYSGGGGTPTTPTPIAAMATDHAAEGNTVNGEDGAWKRTDLTEVINGSGSEGTIIRVITTANKAFELGTAIMRIVPQ